MATIVTEMAASRSILPSGLSYFEYQRRVGREVVIPWLAERLDLDGAVVGDIGAHHGGTLDAFRETGRIKSGVGLELSSEIVATSPFLSDENFRLEVADLMALTTDDYAFDLVLVHDVLEHIPDSVRALTAIQGVLRPRGSVFVSFPPYLSGFGGHQQLAEGRARVVPFLHLLPERMFFRFAAPASQEYMSKRASLADMISVRRTKLTLRKAERSFERSGFRIVDRELFLVRPEYSVRYGMRTRAGGVLGHLPLAREFVVNGAFYLLRSMPEAA